jgi:hypothetical protein
VADITRDEIHQAQAAAEGVQVTGKVTLRGRDFPLGKMAGSNAMAGLRWAKAATSGVGTEDPAGEAALYEMLRSCFLNTPPCGQCKACDDDRYADCDQLDEGAWPAFEKRCIALSVPTDEIFDCLSDAAAQLAARPTQPQSGSSSQGQETSPRLKASSSAPERPLPAAFQRAQDAGDLIDLREIVGR